MPTLKKGNFMRINRIAIGLLLLSLCFTTPSFSKQSAMLDLLFEDDERSAPQEVLDDVQIDEDSSDAQDEIEPTQSSAPCSLLDLLLGDAPDIVSVFHDKNIKYYRGQFAQIGLTYADDDLYDPGMSTEVRATRSIDQDLLTPQEREAVDKYYHLVKQQYEAPWYMKFISKKVGYGIFAAADIEPGQLIGEYTGLIYDALTYTKRTPRNSNYAWSIYAPASKKNAILFHVDAKDHCNFTRMINHSYEPNVIAVTMHGPDGSRILYVATEKIKKDEQILVNYGTGYWEGREPQKLSR